MAESDLTRALDNQAKQAKEESAKQLSKISELIEGNKGSSKQRVQLLKMQEDLRKTTRNVSDDLGKNISDMKDGFMSSVDGMVNQTFGPLGGMVTSLTTGFFKRGKENRENITQNELQNDNAKDLIEKMGGVKDVSEKLAMEQNQSASDTLLISEKMNDNLVAIKESVAGVDDKTLEPDLDKDAAKKGGVGFLMSGGDKIDASNHPDAPSEGGIADKVFDGVTTAVAGAVGVGGGIGGLAAIKALGGKYKAIAGKLTGGVFGKVLSKANPYFAAVMMGKDIFDVANAVTDDDVKSAVKKEDLGGIIGGILGGAVGFALGGPAGLALGAGLGNMAGEFIGGAIDSPEIVGAIQNVKKGLLSEKEGLVSEIAIIEQKLKDKNITAEMKALYEEQLKQNNARVTSISAELDSMKVLDEDIKKLKELDIKASKIATERIRLKKQLKIAEDNGDSARITMLNNLIKVTNEEFSDAEKDYAEQSELLRTKARETTKTLADKSTSFFDKIATEGGALGMIVSALGLGDSLTGTEKDNYLKGEAEKELAELKSDLSEYDSMKINKSLRAGEGSLNYKNQMIKRTTHLIAKKEKELEAMGGLARGGFIVNKPTYLPNSGIVVGEHGTYTGKGAAYGGIADGGAEAVIPLSSTRAGAFIDPMARSIAGQIMNRLQMERMSGGGGGGNTVIDSGNDMSSSQVNNNTTVINNPSPIGQTLPDEGRDFVSKVA